MALICRKYSSGTISACGLVQLNEVLQRQGVAAARRIDAQRSDLVDIGDLF
jgi:hypothetical protein